MDLDLVAGLRPHAVGRAGANHQVLKAGRQGLHPRLRGVLGQEGLAGLGVRGQDLGVGPALAGTHEGEACDEDKGGQAHRCLLQTARGG